MPTERVVSKPPATSSSKKQKTGKRPSTSTGRNPVTKATKTSTLLTTTVTAAQHNLTTRKSASIRRKQFLKAITATTKKRRIQRSRVPGQKRYRQIKIIRPCVIRMIFLVPIAILAIERYLGFIISLDDVRDVYYDQMGIEPWDFIATERISEVKDLANLTYTPPIQCPSGQRRMMSAHNPQLYGLSYRKVPNIVHQTATSRCLTRSLERATLQWAFRKYSYYFHDMDAVKRLVHSDFPEFPQLKLLTESCLTPTLLFGLWKYLILWTYGGIVVDLNMYPSQFNATTVSNEDDAFFLLEQNAEKISSLVMAVSPRHPLMYYAIQHSVSNILHMQPKTMYDPRKLVGEEVLNQAMVDFLRTSTKNRWWKKDHGPTIQQGMFEGMFGRTVRIGGQLSGSDDGIISPIFISATGKRKEFEKIGMNYLEDMITGANCVSHLLH